MAGLDPQIQRYVEKHGRNFVVEKLIGAIDDPNLGASSRRHLLSLTGQAFRTKPEWAAWWQQANRGHAAKQDEEVDGLRALVGEAAGPRVEDLVKCYESRDGQLTATSWPVVEEREQVGSLARTPDKRKSEPRPFPWPQSRLQWCVVGFLVFLVLGAIGQAITGEGKKQQHGQRPSPVLPKSPRGSDVVSPQPPEWPGRPNLPPFSEQVSIVVLPVVLPTRQVLVRGFTNLPSECKVMVTLREARPGGAVFQSKATVQSGGVYVPAEQRFDSHAGRFEAGILGPPGGLSGGRYLVQVFVPAAQVQTVFVRAVIGERGENLKGSLVEAGEVSLHARAEVETVVGGASGLREQATAASTEHAVAEMALQEFLRLYQELEQKRRAGPDEVQWAAFAREHVRRVQTLRQQLDSYPVGPGAIIHVRGMGSTLAVMHLCAPGRPGASDSAKYQGFQADFLEDMEAAKAALAQAR